MMKNHLIQGIVVMLLAFFVTSCSEDKKSDEHIVFMDSFKVFEEFEMKKDYDKRLEAQVGADQMGLDSLGAQLNATTDPAKIAALKKEFTMRKLAFDEKFAGISEQYTSEVYKRLNEYIKAFGKKKGYSIILGSNGQGNVMYVDDKNDITKDLITYINKEYTK